jgi:hypothetical protein
MQYALANDSANMMSQWTDGIVLLQSGAPIMRILQRQSDGSWKIHRGINAVDPQAQ